MFPLGTKSGLLLVTPKEAAAILSISPRKLWSLTASGEIPHLKIGRSVRYPIEDLKDWISSKKNGGEL
jgi:excisionase family DNA binding protein